MRRRYLKRRSALEQSMTLNFRGTRLFLALMLWLCTLPLLVFLAAPFLGWKVTTYLAGFLLVADLVACWFLFAFRPPKSGQ